MNVITLSVGQMKTNCYLVSDPKTAECLIVDPGDDADYIIRKISDHNLIPRGILATHGHFDHIQGVTELKFAYSIPFYLNKNDEFLLKRMRASAKHFLGIKTDPPPKIDAYITKDLVAKMFSGRQLSMISTPGHTPGSISLYFKKNKNVFVGDLMFENGEVGRWDFAYSDQKKLLRSVRKITSLPGDITVYSGHGNSFQLNTFTEIWYNGN